MLLILEKMELSHHEGYNFYFSLSCNTRDMHAGTWMHLFVYILKQCISNVAALILGNILFHILYYYNIPFIIIIIIIIIIIML